MNSSLFDEFVFKIVEGIMIDNFFKQFNISVVNYKLYKTDYRFNELSKKCFYGGIGDINKWQKLLKDYDGENPSKLLNELKSIINGKWLEIYTCSLLLKIINECSVYFKNINYEIFYDVELVSIYNKHFELDVVAAIEDYIYWIECKSGSFDERDIKKYSSINSILQLDENHAFCVLHSAVPKYCQLIEEKYNFRAITSEQFLPLLSKVVFNDLFQIKDKLELNIKNEN